MAADIFNNIKHGFKIIDFSLVGVKIANGNTPLFGKHRQGYNRVVYLLNRNVVFQFGNVKIGVLRNSRRLDFFTRLRIT